MNFGGTVLSIKTNTSIKKKQGGGTYNGYQLVFRDGSGEIKTLEKAMASLTYTPSVAETLNSLAEGDEFNGTMEKDGNFWNVKSLTKGKFVGDAPAQDQPASSNPSRSGSTGGKVVGSNYETPEERKLKQRLIVRQAALNQALQFAPEAKTVADICDFAKHFEEWVYRGLE